MPHYKRTAQRNAAANAYAALLLLLLLLLLLQRAAADCSIALNASLSLRSALSSPPSTTAAAPPLFLRHAGFVAWLTPSADALDAADSTFVARAALSGDAGAVSFENADEFPGYFLAVDAAANNSLRLLQAPDARAASFLTAAGSGGLGCSLESVLLRGALVTALASAAPVDPSPCHYAACPPVAAVTTAAAAPANASTWIVSPPNNAPAPPEAFTAFTAGGLYLEVRNASGTIAVLRAAGGDANFSYVPGEKSGQRVAAGTHRLGDATLRVREYGTAAAWVQASTTLARPGGPVAPIAVPRIPGTNLWAADLTQLLNASSASFAVAAPGLRVVRELTVAPDGLGVVLSILLDNEEGAAAVEVGGLDVSLVTDSDWSGLSLEQNAARCSLAEPYTGLDGGFVRIVRITGEGPALLVTPSSLGCSAATAAPPVACGGAFENYRRLSEDPATRGVTFEGYYAYSLLTRAWAEAEWASAEQFNAPSSLVLRGGEAAVFSLRLAVSPSLAEADVDAVLVAAGLPLVRSSPGTVLAGDVARAHLLVRPPPGYALAGVAIEPPFAMAVGAAAPAPAGAFFPLVLPLEPAVGATGRARLTLRFAAASLSSTPAVLLQTVHYFLLPPLPLQAQRLAAFASGTAWINDTSDAFGRAFAFAHWDAGRGAQTLQESRAWVAGLSDESGAGMALAAASLAAARPDDDGAALAAAQLATYVNRPLLGAKNDSSGRPTSLQQADGGVRASMFFSGLPSYPYTVSPCWDEPRSLTTWRAYNYPHQVGVLLSLFRIGRDAPCTTARAQRVAATSGGALDAPQPWQSYLRGAAATHAAMWTHCGPGASYFLAQ